VEKLSLRKKEPRSSYFISSSLEPHPYVAFHSTFAGRLAVTWVRNVEFVDELGRESKPVPDPMRDKLCV
jgi:hypothetical protein